MELVIITSSFNVDHYLVHLNDSPLTFDIDRHMYCTLYCVPRLTSKK